MVAIGIGFGGGIGFNFTTDVSLTFSNGGYIVGVDWHSRRRIARRTYGTTFSQASQTNHGVGAKLRQLMG